MSGGWALLPRKVDRQTGRFIRDCTAELFGTFSLIFWGCGSAVSGHSALHIAFGFGFGIASTVHIFNDISGANFNPAVSLALFVAQKISFLRCICYAVCQFIGGFLAAALLYGICGSMPGETSLGTYYRRGSCEITDAEVPTKAEQVCRINDVHDITTGAGFVLELMGTLFLVFVVLATTNEKRGQAASYHQPLSIGICVFAIHLMLIPLTGCGINPVRGIVPSIIAEDVMEYHWIYIVAPLCASVVGGLSYLLFFDPHYPPAQPRKVMIELDETVVVKNNGTS